MSMFSSGVLVLTRLPKTVYLRKVLAEASKCVSKILYVDLLNPFIEEGHGNNLPAYTLDKGHANEIRRNRIHFDLMKKVYASSGSLCGNVDVRVLLPPAKTNHRRAASTLPFELCIANTSSVENVNEFEHLTSSRYAFLDNRFHVRYIHAFDEFEAGQENTELGSTENKENIPQECSGVVIGGTFDRIHEGHKLLMGVAALFATTKVTVGVSDTLLLKRKVLRELLESTEERIENVTSFLKDIKPGLELKIVPLDDPAGPSGTDRDLQLLVLTQETVNGAEYVNNIRKQNGLYTLDVFVLDLIQDSSHDIAKQIQKEEKISSSMKRIRLLGELLKPPPKPCSRANPYIIGLTGGIASGKTSVSKRLQKLGAAVINCDSLGHQAYAPGRKAYSALLQHFGSGILREDGTVDRKKLGAIVFSDKAQLAALNRIVWPEIANMVSEQINQYNENGSDVVVVEAAILLEAGWEHLVNEVWVTFIPEEEAIRRITERDHINEDQATLRVQSQASNIERIKRANVVFSTLWEPEITQKQVEKAWTGLCRRAKPNPSPQL